MCLIGELAKAANTTIAGFMPVAVVEVSNRRLVPERRTVEAGLRQTTSRCRGGIPVRTSAAVYKIRFRTTWRDHLLRPRLPGQFDTDDRAAGANILAVPAIDPYTLSHLRWQSLVFRAVENGTASRLMSASTRTWMPTVLSEIESLAVDGRGSSWWPTFISDRDAPFTDTGGYTCLVRHR